MSILQNIDRQYIILNILKQEFYCTDQFDPDSDMESNYISMIWNIKDIFINEIKRYCIGLYVRPKINGLTIYGKWHITDFELRSNCIEYEVRDEYGNNKHRFYSSELEIEQ